MIEEAKKGFHVDSAALDFLVYTLFGKPYGVISEMAGDEMDGVLDLCAQRAYRDLSRTLPFYSADGKEGRKEAEAKKRELLEKAKKAVVDGSKDLLGSGSRNEFDRLHREICEGNSCRSIIVAAKEAPGDDVLKPVGKEGKTFYPGQAQKWLNMTLKYFWILDSLQFKDEPCPVEAYLHAPIDSFVLKALLKDENLSTVMQTRGLANGADAKKVIEAAHVPWSQWSYEDYAEIQALVRGLSEPSGRCPIEWEMHAWLDAGTR